MKKFSITLFILLMASCCLSFSQDEAPLVEFQRIWLNKYTNILPGDTLELNMKYKIMVNFPCYVGYTYYPEIFQPLDTLTSIPTDSIFRYEILEMDSGKIYEKNYKFIIKQRLNFGEANLDLIIRLKENRWGYVTIEYQHIYLLFNDSLDGYIEGTDVKEVSNKNPLNAEIVPNPIVNSGNLQLNLPKDCKLNIKIVDILGNEYYNINQQYLQGFNSIPLPTLNTGTYIANIYYDNKFISKKFVVLR